MPNTEPAIVLPLPVLKKSVTLFLPPAVFEAISETLVVLTPDEVSSPPESLSSLTLVVGVVGLSSAGGFTSSLNSVYPAGIGYIGFPFTNGIYNSSPCSLTNLFVSVFCNCPNSAPM